MKLCLGIIEDSLSGHVIKSCTTQKYDYFIERCEHYCGGASLTEGVLYLAKAEELPEMMPVTEHTAMICAGMPPDHYVHSLLRLLVIEETANLFELANEVSGILFKFNSLERELNNSVNSGKSVQYMVEQIAPCFNGNELLVITDEFKVIGKSNPTLHMREMAGLPQPDENGFVDPEMVAMVKNDLGLQRMPLLDITEPIISDPSFFPCRNIVTNLFRDGICCGRILLGDDRTPFRGYEEGLLKFFHHFVQLFLDSPANRGKTFGQSNMPVILAKLLKGETVGSSQLDSVFSRHGWSSSGPYLCVCILPSEGDYYMRSIQHLCNTYNSEYPGCCFFEHGGNIVCVVNLEEYGKSVDIFASAFEEILAEQFFHAGYSNIFADIKELPSYYLQANIALKTGLQRLPASSYFKFSDLVMPYFESKLTEDLDGRILCAPEILTLLRYDQNNNTDYLNTLKTYLDNQLNALKTSRDLFIHRNSIEQRLRRIKELTDIDFSDDEKILYCKMSFRFLLK